jgi:hypothetical protein
LHQMRPKGIVHFRQEHNDDGDDDDTAPHNRSERSHRFWQEFFQVLVRKLAL